MGGDTFWVEFDRLGEVGKSALIVAVPSIGIPASPVTGGKFRIDLDRLVRVGDSSIAIAFAPVGSAASHVGVGISRIDLDRIVLVGDGAIEIALPPIARATMVVYGWEVTLPKLVRVNQARAGGDCDVVGVLGLA
jgi:hypothetical protein